MANSLHAWVPATQVGNQDRVPISCLWLGPVWQLCTFGIMNEGIGDNSVSLPRIVDENKYALKLGSRSAK